MSSYGGQRRADDRRGTYTQKAANQVVEKSIDGGDDDEIRSRIAANQKAFRKNYEIAIPTRNLKWTNLARYLELEFKEFGVQIPKDQKKVTVMSEHFVVMLPVRLTAAQKQDIDLLRGSQDEIDEFFQALEEEKQLGTVPEDSEV